MQCGCIGDGGHPQPFASLEIVGYDPAVLSASKNPPVKICCAAIGL